MSSGSKIISWQRGPQFTRKMKHEDLIPVFMPECQYRSTFTHFTAIHVLYYCLYHSYGHPMVARGSRATRQEKEPWTHNVCHMFHAKDPCHFHCQSFLILLESSPHTPAGRKFTSSRGSKSLKWGNHCTFSLPKMSSPFLSPPLEAQHNKHCITAPPLWY